MNSSRLINYLRISVTDRCNLRCKYCIPPEGVSLISHNEILRYEELERIINLFEDLGINKIRITGGEPLIRKGILGFLQKIDNHNIHLTTNLTVDEKKLSELNQIKLQSINLSIDTLNRNKYKYLTGKDLFETVKKNIKALKIKSKKSNTVIMRGINEDEIIDIVKFGIKNNISVRFIEKMNWVKDNLQYVPNNIIKDRLIKSGMLLNEKVKSGDSVAIYYKVKDSDKKVGFISPISEKFCYRCNRIRLTSDGNLKLCLYDKKLYDIKTYIRSDASDAEIKEKFKDLILKKPLDCNDMTGNNMSFYGG